MRVYRKTRCVQPQAAKFEKSLPNRCKCWHPGCLRDRQSVNEPSVHNNRCHFASTRDVSQGTSPPTASYRDCALKISNQSSSCAHGTGPNTGSRARDQAGFSATKSDAPPVTRLFARLHSATTSRRVERVVFEPVNLVAGPLSGRRPRGSCTASRNTVDRQGRANRQRLST